MPQGARAATGLLIILFLVIPLSGCVTDDDPREALPFPGETTGRGVTVVAVVDSFLNPYHWDFLAAHMPQHRNPDPSDDLPLDTDPETWIPGHPGEDGFASIQRLDLTLTPDDPDAVPDGLYEKDKEAWQSVRVSDRQDVHMHWIPDTKVVGFVNFREGSDGYNDLFHGTAVASSSIGNFHGTCPECVFVLVHRDYEDVEAANEWVLEQDWIDVQINSWGGPSPLDDVWDSLDGTGAYVYDGFYGGSDTQKQARASERGQAAFYASGNGVTSGFAVPNPTLWSSQKGTDWGFTVGAIDPEEHQSISGAGIPVDVSAIGQSYPVSGGGTVSAESSFSGTSNAAPVAAGVYARALWLLRQELASERTQRDGLLAAMDADPVQNQCGEANPECALADGELRVEELREAYLRTAEHRAEGLLIPGIVRTHEETDETRFASQGHGSYLGRPAEDWQSESGKVAAYANGSWHEPRDEDLDAWMIALSWCRQTLWGPWAHGDHGPGIDLPPVDPLWPLRSWLIEECPRSGKTFQDVVFSCKTDGIHPLPENPYHQVRIYISTKAGSPGMRFMVAAPLALALVFAGCVQPGDDVTPPGTDDVGPFWDATGPVEATDATGDVHVTSIPEATTSPERHLDLVQAALVEATAEGLTVSLTVDEITEEGPERPEGFVENSIYRVCWSHDEGPDRCASFERSFNSGPLVEAASFSINSGSCNEFGQCLWQVPAELETGSPGVITWQIPWSLALWGETGTQIESIEARSVAVRGAEATGQHGAFSFTLPGVPHTHEHPFGTPFLPQAEDSLEGESVSVRLMPPAVPEPERSYNFTREGSVGYTWGKDRQTTPAIDLVGLDVQQEEDDLFVTFKVAELTEMPEEQFHLTLDLGVVGSEYWEIGLYHVLNPDHLGEVYAYAGRCITWHCGEGYAHGTLETVDFEVEFGSPGSYTITAPLEHIGGTALREVTLLRAWAMTSDANLFWGSPGDDVQGDIHVMRETDILYGGSPFWIGHEGGTPADGHGHH